MSSRPRALIIGGSVGGLLASALLRQAGWEAVIYERTIGDLAGRGAGLGISQDLVDILRDVGARFEPSAGSAHDAYVWMREDESLAFAHRRPTVGSTWPRVYQPLRALAPEAAYIQGANLLKVTQDSQSVTAHFADGSTAHGDVLVAADGALSTVRRQFLPDVAPVYASYVAWRGLTEEADMSAAALEAIGHQVVYCFPEGEMLLAMTVPGAGDDMRPGYRRIYFIWYRPVSREGLFELFTDAAGNHHGVSIPPPLIRPEFTAEVKCRAREVLPRCIAEAVERAPQILLQAVSDLQTPQMVFGRVAMMGDAAFIARPHTAAGVSKAALDAQCLAHELAKGEGVDGALSRYEASRMNFGRKLCAHSRYLGIYLEGQSKPPAERSEAEAQRDPAKIIREYGAQMLLRDVDVSAFQPH
jgi:2-polyprenyl-6-methoxyphenol hydroxylase-like FAD-dependent oxidoreductase